MTPEKLKRLEAAGFVHGDAKELLGLTPDEAKLVELRVEIAKAFRAIRKEAGMTQAELAQRIGSSQSRIAATEHGIDAGMDLLVRCLYAVGGVLKPIVPPAAKLPRVPSIEHGSAKMRIVKAKVGGTRKAPRVKQLSPGQ